MNDNVALLGMGGWMDKRKKNESVSVTSLKKRMGLAFSSFGRLVVLPGFLVFLSLVDYRWQNFISRLLSVDEVFSLKANSTL